MDSHDSYNDILLTQNTFRSTFELGSLLTDTSKALNPFDVFDQLIDDEIITKKYQTTVDIDVNSKDTKWPDISDGYFSAAFEKLDNGLCPISSDLTVYG